MRKSSRGNPYHDSRGRFASCPGYSYAMTDDGAHITTYRNGDIQDEMNVNQKELDERGGVDGYVTWLYGVTRCEKTKAEYDARTKKRLAKQDSEQVEDIPL